MKKLVVWAVCVAACIPGLAQTLQAPFVHPGLNHSRADLDRMKEKVLAKEHPWIEGGIPCAISGIPVQISKPVRNLL